MLTTELMELLNCLFTRVDDPPADDPPGDDPPADDPPADDPPGGDDPPGKDEETVPIADLRKVRREAADRRKKLATVEAELEALKKSQAKAAEDAELEKMEEGDRYKKQVELAEAKIADFERNLADANARNTVLQKKAAVQNAAMVIGFANPADAAVFVDLTEIEIVDGKVDLDAVNEAVEQLADEKSYLLMGKGEEELKDFGGGRPKPDEGPRVRLTDKGMTKRLQDKLNAERASHTVEGRALFGRLTEIYDSQSGGRVQADRDGQRPKRDADRIERRTRKGS